MLIQGEVDLVAHSIGFYVTGLASVWVVVQAIEEHSATYPSPIVLPKDAPFELGLYHSYRTTCFLPGIHKQSKCVGQTGYPRR